MLGADSERRRREDRWPLTRGWLADLLLRGAGPAAFIARISRGRRCSPPCAYVRTAALKLLYQAVSRDSSGGDSSRPSRSRTIRR